MSNRSRNTVFELNLLGRLALHGAVIEQHPLVDVAARVDGDLYFFQCKRPFADGKVEKLVKKAYHQLERDLATVNNAWGVIAVSLSRLINPGTFVFLGRSETPFRDLSRELEPYDSRLSSLHKQCRHPRVLGVVLHFITPGVVLPSSTPIHIEQRGRAHSFHPFDAALHARFWRLTQHLTDRIVEA